MGIVRLFRPKFYFDFWMVFRLCVPPPIGSIENHVGKWNSWGGIGFGKVNLALWAFSFCRRLHSTQEPKIALLSGFPVLLGCAPSFFTGFSVTVQTHLVGNKLVVLPFPTSDAVFLEFLLTLLALGFDVEPFIRLSNLLVGRRDSIISIGSVLASRVHTVVEYRSGGTFLGLNQTHGVIQVEVIKRSHPQHLFANILIVDTVEYHHFNEMVTVINFFIAATITSFP